MAAPKFGETPLTSEGRTVLAILARVCAEPEPRNRSHKLPPLQGNFDFPPNVSVCSAGGSLKSIPWREFLPSYALRKQELQAVASVTVEGGWPPQEGSIMWKQRSFASLIVLALSSSFPLGSALAKEGVSFEDPMDFGVGRSPRSVAAGDFNGDGQPDLAVANFASNSVSILLGQGAGRFAEARNVSVGTNPYFVAVGDFNSDGLPDIAVADAGSNDVTIVFNKGNGEFGNEQARLFAARLSRQVASDSTSLVREGLWRVLQREPTSVEIERGVAFLARLRTRDRVEPGEALRLFCLLALNLNEFIYLE